MTGSIAHEVNQPLTAILNYATGCVRRLGSGIDEKGMLRSALKHVADEAQRAGKLIRHLRDLTAWQRPEMQLNSLDETLARSLFVSESLLQKSGTKVIPQLAIGLPMAFFDKLLIVQVLCNLIRNGVEAMEETNPNDRTLVIEAKKNTENTLQVSVRDNGVGLSHEEVTQLFVPLRTTKQEGVGLGLVISKCIVELHGGRLWGTPQAEGGASFHFTLPVQSKEMGQ